MALSGAFWPGPFGCLAACVDYEIDDPDPNGALEPEFRPTTKVEGLVIFDPSLRWL